MKHCFKCGEEKELFEFYCHQQMADGHLNKCKLCAKLDVRLHRKDNNHVREYDRQRSRSLERRAAVRANTKRWRQQNPDRYKAETAVNNAVRDGRLTKESCEVCGSTKVHGHHDDYTKPFEVRWLCAQHHQRTHHPLPF